MLCPTCHHANDDHARFVEQAPQRAVRAALALQEAVAQYSAKLEREHGMCLQVRVGINTGPMEQTAAPGTIQITAQTYKLVAGYFDCDDLGLVGVKGITSKVRAYRVTGEHRAQARIDVARERGFTRLVGREQELHLLCEGVCTCQGGVRSSHLDHW